MRSALLVLFALAWWPFHHKAAPSNEVMTPLGVIHVKDSDCSFDVGTWYFAGPDGMIGTSKDSCAAAFNDWATDTGNFPAVSKI